MRQLIINADDFGLSDGICRAVHELFDAGAISSTTLMLAAEGAIDRCRTWNIRQLVGKAGVHLQLTGGIPILPGEQVPSIIDGRTGKFRSKAEFSSLNPKDVKREWRAQIQVACDLLGTKPSHLDSHHGAHHVPGLAEVFISLALEFDLPVRDRTAMCEYMPETRLRGSDVVIYEWTARGLNSADLERDILSSVASSSDGEILELVTHPGYSDAELRKVSTLHELRERDLVSLFNLAQSQWFEQEGIQLISFSEIR